MRRTKIDCSEANMLIIAALIVGGYTNHAWNVVAGWPIKLTATQVVLAESGTPFVNDQRPTTMTIRQRLTAADQRLHTR